MEFDQQKYDDLKKLFDLLEKDEALDNMLKLESGSENYLLIALEAALPILKEKLRAE